MSICLFDWLNPNKHSAFSILRRTDGLKVCIFSGTKIIFSGAKINFSPTKIVFSVINIISRVGRKNNFSATKNNACISH